MHRNVIHKIYCANMKIFIELYMKKIYINYMFVCACVVSVLCVCAVFCVLCV